MKPLTKEQEAKIDELLSRCGDNLTTEQRQELYMNMLENKIQFLSREVEHLKQIIGDYQRREAIIRNQRPPNGGNRLEELAAEVARLRKALERIYHHPRNADNTQFMCAEDSSNHFSTVIGQLQHIAYATLSTPSPAADCVRKLVEALRTISDSTDPADRCLYCKSDSIAKEALAAARKAGLV